MNIIRSLFDKMFNWGEIEQANTANSQQVKLNPFTLSFPKELERDFFVHYDNDSKGKMNIALIVGGIFYSLFFFLDLLLVPELFTNFFIVRFVVTWLTVGFTLFYINLGKHKKLYQPLIGLTSIIVTATIIYYIIIAYPKLNNSYYVGIIIIYYWSYSFLKLRYIWATIAGIITFWMYQFTTFFVIDLGYETYIISTSFLLATNFVGMIISYTLEYYARKDFYQNKLLKNSIEANINLNMKIDEGDYAMKLAQEQLMLQSHALESAANSIIIFDLSGKIIWCNQAFLNLTGYSQNEVMGKTSSIIKSGKHDKVFYTNLWTTILEGKVWSGEIINKKKNGELYHEEMTITPVTNNSTSKITHFIAIKQNITMRKKMEDKLYKSEKRLRSFVENATVGIYRTNHKGEILLANDALINMLGFNSIEELQDRNLSNAGYVDPNQREIFIKNLNEKGNLIGFESEWEKADGSVITIRESARLDYDDKGNQIFEGTVEDITLSKLAEIELKDSRERLQSVIDNVNDAIFIHDTEGNIIDVNNKVLDLYNISRDEVLRYKINDISADDNSLEKVNDYWDKVISQNKTFKFDWIAKRPNDNSVFDVEVFIARITLSNNDYILANVRDITEEKEANKRLLVTQKAIEMNATPIFWITKNAEFVYINQAAVEMLNYTKEELLSMKVYDVDKQWNEKYWNEFGYPMLKEKNLAQFESVHVTKDGKEIPIEVNASIINYEKDELIVAIVNDITERQKISSSLIEAKEKAEQSDKLKSDFLAGMSHEIRTPVNTILNFISLIRSDLGENISVDIQDSFKMIDSGSRRLIRTIDSIINMSQLQSGIFDLNFETINLVEDILNPLLNEYKPVAANKNLKFALTSKMNEYKIQADTYTVNQLFINLIDNAIKYTVEGSVNVVVDSDSNFVIVKIIDTGIGISESFLPGMFEPFVQEEMGYTRSFEGNGLGLALVKKYVELNNAEITVESQKEQGSTFTVKLNRTNQITNQEKKVRAIKKEYLNTNTAS